VTLGYPRQRNPRTSPSGIATYGLVGKPFTMNPSLTQLPETLIPKPESVNRGTLTPCSLSPRGRAYVQCSDTRGWQLQAAMLLHRCTDAYVNTVWHTTLRLSNFMNRAAVLHVGLDIFSRLCLGTAGRNPQPESRQRCSCTTWG